VVLNEGVVETEAGLVETNADYVLDLAVIPIVAVAPEVAHW